MESSKEKIEAQLCAYIEGELDEADRADIERHLQTNPQHKSLIAELRLHRELLQTLPRATIPGELNENLTGQLERSALLSDDDETAEAGVRINRWPQLAAVAAVLLLAVGLGIVVVYVLPPAGAARRASVALDTASPHRSPASEPAKEKLVEQQKNGAASTEPSGGIALGRDTSEMDALTRRGLSVATTSPAPLEGSVADKRPAAAPNLVTAATPEAAITRMRELTSGPGLVTPAEVEDLQRRMSRALGGEANRAFNLEPRNSLYLIVQTPNATVASGQVASYFKANNIQYMNYEGGLPGYADAAAKTLATAATDRDDAASDVRRGGALGGGLSSPIPRGERRFGGGGFGGAAGAGAPAPVPAPAQGQATDTKLGAPAAPPAGAQPAEGPAYGRVAKKQAAGEAETRVEEAKAAPRPDDLVKMKSETSALTDKASDNPKDELTLNHPATAGRAAEPEALTQAGQTTPLVRGRIAGTQPADGLWSMRTAPQFGEGAAAAAPARGGVIVARMNRRQADELRATLSRELGQRAELRDFAGIAASASTANPADGAKAPVAGKPATDPQADLGKRSEAPAPSESLRLTPHPADQPVDVVIVVKPEVTSAAASAGEGGKSNTDAKK